MYAVVEIGGHQYRVSQGDVLFVDKQDEATGEELTFDRVLLINDGKGGVTLGQPIVEGASIKATLLGNVKADKVIVFKKKRRKGYQVKNGHRQPVSQIEIGEISTSAKKKSKQKTKKSPAKEEKATKKQHKLSTDMSAQDAIDHIKNTPLDQLEGFVPDNEERVTVTRAWESKQED